jgi:hypothetical protein
MSSTTIVQIALTCEREMPTAGRTVGASRSVSPGPPRSPSLRPDSVTVSVTPLLPPLSPLSIAKWYGMIWCPSYPPQRRGFAEGGGVMQRPSGQCLSEQHRQAVQSALVRTWVRPCDAGTIVGKNGTYPHKLPASDEAIGHIVAMHLLRVVALPLASNKVAGQPA